MVNPFELTGRKILITGASSGIGRACALLMSELGARLVLCDKNEQGMNETAAMLNGGGHTVIPFDVTDFDDYDGLFKQAVSDDVKLNGLVHCVGVARALPMRMMTYDRAAEVLNINYLSFLMMTSTYAKKKYSSGGGSIVAISAVNAHNPQKGMTVYAGSKAAIEASVKTLALEFAQQDTRINCIAPGAVDTPMSKDVDEETLKKITEHQLLGMSKPEDIANAAAFLMSSAAASITGRTLFADGGMLGQQV